jgi:hypothetical protein
LNASQYSRNFLHLLKTRRNLLKNSKLLFVREFEKYVKIRKYVRKLTYFFI